MRIAAFFVMEMYPEVINEYSRKINTKKPSTTHQCDAGLYLIFPMWKYHLSEGRAPMT
jgi:hypothetical protein